ncbi:hypothetical protein HZF07_10845 [Nocardioides sp. CGMCC 1.13656]|uniref:DUF6492 family protein n=1 Tax=Nocardioides TaxID=1839 RepID=UPI0012F7D35E|nr:DUF6492 family protein [Nocardioides sp. CGMCC 1.13656]MBA2954216.1 hypothetical protein [Nocardioides sp. CGMCC 1.13656]
MEATPRGRHTPRSFSAGDISLVTVSYRDDLDLARELCRSVDTYLEPGAEHVLIVPRCDVAMFATLAAEHRRIVAVEDVLPRGYVKLPAPRHVRLGPFHRRIREIWASPVGIVRGWIVQQIVKMSAPAFTDREIVVFADSDIVLVAPLTVDRLTNGPCVRLYRLPGATADLPTHVGWHSVSARLLGLEQRGYLGSDYIGNLITWRRSNILLLQQRLAEVAGRRWDKEVARQSDFSEYILYGIFADLVLDEASGHDRTSEDLVHAGWFYDLHTPAGLEDFVHGFRPGQVGVAIQSTEAFALDERRELVRRIVSEAARAGEPRG